MHYYFSKTVDLSFEKALEKAVGELKKEGFGVLTEIDVRATMKQKLGVDFRKYTILGMCNPQFAYRALTEEDKIGLMLPCNAIVQETRDGGIEVAIVDPAASMASIDNPALWEVAQEVRRRLSSVIDRL